MGKHYFSIIVFSCSLFFATSASAAELSFEHVGEVGVNDEVEVRVVLDAQGGAVNALEGILTFSPNLQVKEIRDGNSFVSLWLERPHVERGAISFSGVIPGGYAGKDWSLFSVVFVAQEEGSALLSVKGARMFQNDGRGTLAPSSVVPSYVIVSRDGSGSGSVATLEDSESPESFSPEIAQSNTLFDGQHFLVFATQDKRSGVAFYEVFESKWNIFWVPEVAWKKAESPYVLEDQSQRSYVYVRATDKAGNARVEMLWPKSIGFWNILYLLILATLGVATVYGAILFSRYWKQRRISG